MTLEPHATAVARGHPPADRGGASARGAGQPRRDGRHQGGERLRRLAARWIAARRRAPSRSASTPTIAASSAPTSCRVNGVAAAAPRDLGHTRLGVGARAHQSGPAAARRPRPAAAEHADPVRALPGRWPRGRGERCLSTPTTSSRSRSSSTSGSAPTSRRCWRCAASSTAGDGDRVAVERFAHGVRFTVRGRDGRHRATTVTADRAVGRGDGADALRFSLELPPGGRRRSRCTTGSTRVRRPPPRPTDLVACGARAPRRGRGSPSARRRDGRRAVQPGAAAGAARHPHAALAARFPGLLRRGRAVVRDALRSRLADLRDADARLRFADGGTDAARARRAARHARRSDARRRAGEGAARVARRRDRRARALPARPLLRDGRRHAALPLPAQRARGLERRPGAVRGAAWPRSRRCWAGSTGRATAIATACSSTPSVRRKACATRAGRTPTRASSTSTAHRWSRRRR